MALIREMTDGDAPRVLEIYRQGIESGISTFTRECPSYEEWNGAHLPFCRFVYEDGGDILGWVAVSPTSSRDVYRGVAEMSLYVDTGCFHRGVGTALITYLMEEAPKHGLWCIYSVALETNPRSIALHEKCGFRKVGYRERIARDRFGEWQNTVVFEKRL